MKFMAQCSRKKVGLTIGMTKNAVKSMDYSKFIGLGLKLQTNKLNHDISCSLFKSTKPENCRFPLANPHSAESVYYVISPIY
jgi:hypothetical protein